MDHASETDSESIFGRLLVEQGLARAEHVEECLALLRRFVAEGVHPLPRLGSLLLQKGYLTLERYNQTLVATPPTQGTRPAAGAALPPEIARALEIPENAVGKYVRLSLLGAGGMGEVWRAWDRELARWVALKFLKGSDPGELARFQREAQTAARLSHPNIAAVYDVGEEAGRSYIAMQLVEGSTLAAVPREERRRLATLVRDAALAVHYAHLQGVVHRDLKPQNLMVSEARVFVMDFGLAKQAAADSSLSLSGSILGTPAYMAPEQARGRLADIDARSDVYSLGATLYALLAGRPPLDAPDVYDLLRKVVEEEPRPLRALDPRIDDDLGTIAAKCLEKDRDRRYATARELADDLSRFLEGEPIAARLASVAYRMKKRILKNAALSMAIAAAAAIAVTACAVLIVGTLRRDAERESRAELLLKESETRHARQDWAGALETLGQYLAIRPADARAGRMKSDCDRAVEDQRRQAALRAAVEAASERCRLAMERAKEAKALLRMRASRREEWEKLFREALAIADSALEKYPDLAATHYTLGEIREGQGRWREAIASFDRALALDPALSEAWRRRGLCHLEIYAEEVMLSLGSKGNKWVVTESTAERRSREDPHKTAAFDSFSRHANLNALDPATTREWRCMEAAAALADGRHAEAEQAFDRLLEETRTDDRIWILKAAAQHAQAKYVEALGTADTLIQDVLPQDSRAHVMRAWTRACLQNWAGAVEDSNRAISLDPASARAHLVRGMSRAYMLDPGGALKDIDKVIELEPRNPYGYTVRAYARGLLRNWKGAAEDYGRAIELNPRRASSYVRRGTARAKLGDSQGALEDYRTAVEIDPSDPGALHLLIDSVNATGDRAATLQVCDRLIELLPRNGSLYYWRARLRSDRGELAPSLPDYDRAVALEPGRGDYRHFRGATRIGVADWKGAEEDFVIALELAPENPWNHAGLGRARMELGDLDRALAHCNEALRLGPADSTLYPVRGRVHLARKEYARALDDFKKAVALWGHLAGEVEPLMAECRKNLPKE